MAGAAGMAALNRRLEKIPDEAVRELVAWFVPRSEKVGGRMRWFGRNVKLTTKIRSKKKRTDTSTVVLAGFPAACWSIKSYGRRGGYPVRQTRANPIPARSGLRLATVAPGAWFIVKTPTTGDKRWDKLVAEADRKFPDVVAGLIDRKVII